MWSPLSLSFGRGARCVTSEGPFHLYAQCMGGAQIALEGRPKIEILQTCVTNQIATSLSLAPLGETTWGI